MFLSKTKRNMTKKSAQNSGCQIVAYDDKLHTISENVRKRTEQANNPLLAQLSTKNNTTMAFSSNAPRFNQKQADESETFLGPGYYEQRSCFNQERSKTAKRPGGIHGNAATGLAIGSQGGQGAVSHGNLGIQNANTKSQHFMSSAGRFGSPDKKTTGKEATPGPGHYSQENIQKWFKRSYNMNFSEV